MTAERIAGNQHWCDRCMLFFSSRRNLNRHMMRINPCLFNDNSATPRKVVDKLTGKPRYRTFDEQRALARKRKNENNWYARYARHHCLSPSIHFFISPGRRNEAVRCAGSNIGRILDEKKRRRQLIVREGVPMMPSLHPSKEGDASGPQYYGRRSIATNGAKAGFRNKRGSWRHITM